LGKLEQAMPVKFFDGILNVEEAITYGVEVNR